MVLNVLVAGYANEAAKRDIVAKLAAALEAIDSGRYTVDSTVYAPEEEAKLVRTRHGNLILAVDDEAGVAERKQHMYHVRALLVAGATTDDVAQFAAKTIVSGGVTRYVSTRGAATEAPVTFLDAVRLGLAHDGGLYVPKESPSPLPQTTLNYLFSPAGPATYIGLAQIVLEHLVDRNQVPPGVLSTMISTAYDAAAWGGSADCCPVTDVTSAAARAAGIHVALSEQFHGPTSAFKDFALQLFPQFFDLATTMDDSESSGANYLILTATSGDTGGAAINGFVRGAPHIKVMVLYPTKGVSPVQRVQMLSMHGGNVHVLAVDGDFDLCQSAVKTIFGNTELKKKLRDTCGTELSSANSINWGRLLPQIVYYVWSYASLVRQGKLVSGEPMDVCIPTGNFGNILACFYAKSIGVPIGRLILASNCNDVLADFVNTGVYDISARSLSLTASPSIDILRASNVERFLFLCTGGDAVTVASLMASLNSEKKRFEAPEAVKAVLRSTFWALQCNEADCRKIIRDTLTESGKLIDPHTAVAVHVATQYLHATAVQGKAKCILVASTAHWAKFPEPVAEAIGALPSGGLKGNAASVADIKELYRSIVAAAATTSVSLPLADILSRPGLLEHGPRVGGTVDEVVSQLLTFAAATATAATSSA